MSQERWQRVKALFLEALELSAEDRLSYLESKCGTDAELLNEVLEMLATAESDDLPLKPASPLSPRATDFPSLAGTTIDDFEIQLELGRGGMGVVYLARQISLDRKVALKVLLPHLAKVPEYVARFEREAQKMAKLDHPGIVAVHSVDSAGDVHFFAMELVSGHDLASELEALRPLAITNFTARHLPAFDAREYVTAVVDLAIQAGDALAHAHDRGVIHRDVKPKNLLLADDGRLMLVDFGLARDARYGEITRPGDVAGTPHYMSPEQAEMHARRTIDHRTDVYSLGVVLYEMLTLRRPFDGQTSVDILRQIANRDPVAIERSNPRVPRDLRTICLKAMEKQPEHRYPTAHEFVLDLRRFQSHAPIHARPPSLARRVGTFVHRRRWALGAAAIAAVALSAGIWITGHTVRASDDAALCVRLRERIALDEVSNADALALADVDRFLRVNGEGTAELKELHARLRALFDARKDRLARAAEATKTKHTPRTSLDESDDEATVGASEYMKALVSLTAYTGNTVERASYPKDSCRVAFDVKTLMPSTEFALFVQRLDTVTGRIGRTQRMPIARDKSGRFVIDLPPGPYRITASEPKVGFSEFVRDFEHPETEYVIAVWIRSDDEVRRTATRITGAKYTVHTYVARHDGGPGNEAAETIHDVADFDLDRLPVTCAEYERFRLETSARRPAFWSETSAQDWPTRPVTMIAADEARSFSEWRGMRLPTLPEWELAVRGVARTLLPPTISAKDPTLGGIHVGLIGPKTDLPREEGFAELRRWFEVSVLPVGVAPAFVGDIRDVLGNVREWSESWDFDFTEGEYRGDLGLRIRYGASCMNSLSKVASKGFDVQIQAPYTTKEIDCGFRCAKSARPPVVE